MFLDKYLTEYDDSLAGESYIDPLGMLVIWSAFGQEIFKNRVNSISNDVRNYTLNLFNHYLIKKLINDDSVDLSRALLSVYGGKDTLQFKYACLVYLESLFVFSILAHEGWEGVDSGGVLGITKARRKWSESNNDPTLVFSHEKISHLLVRQLSLGVSGRYKTPLMEIGYFDGNYHYQLPKATTLWERAEKFIVSTPELHKLAEAAFNHLRGLLSQNSKTPQLSFSEVPGDLQKAYVNTLASPGAVGRYARDYWLDATGLDRGAAGALLQVLDENADTQKPRDLEPQELITLALKKELPGNEITKMQHIVLLEPFLADATLLFTLLTIKKSQPLKAVIAQWQQFNRDEYTLPSGAMRVLKNPDLIKVLSGTARARLLRLLQLSEKPTMEEQISLLIEYHVMVMEGRGQSTWLSVDHDRLVKVHTRPSRPPDADNWPNGCWANSYYLPQFNWLVLGYQGGTA